jgi:prevent-host-death family protein
MASRNGSYTTSDLSRKSGDIIAEALRHPVTITQRSKPRLVILNIDDYERLMKGADALASRMREKARLRNGKSAPSRWACG